MSSKDINASPGMNSIKAEVDEIKRRRILEEAIGQFFEKGYEATSLESIADGLGVTKQFIYSRFRSKSELLVSICHAGATAADQTVEFSATLTGDPVIRLARLIEYFVKLQIEHRREVALYFREAKSLPPEEARAIDDSKMRFHRMLCALLNDGKAAGLFDFDDTSLAASALGGMASWAFTWFQPEGRWVADSVARQLAVLALKTVGVSNQSLLPLTDRS
jgi:TetR/AcrR family transcriptional regulator, cholesterol catabolism regulator